jgi:hypothetical protein
MAIANARDLDAIKMNIARTIVDHNKIVAGPVHLRETQHAFSSSTLCPESQRPLPVADLALTCPFVKTVAGWALIVTFALTMRVSLADDCNELILEQVKQMPQGGRYSVSSFAKIQLQSAAHFESGKFFILPSAASPSFCSGATYLVFIRTIEALRARGELHLDFATLDQLIIRDQHDGEGIWGRWNANGPGTARLFHELGLGRNFDNFDQAKPGDFLKIFWSRQVGRSEHGHSTIFLGTENRLGVEYVRYWSSNIPSGYGEKSVQRSKIAYAIFSRLQTPANLTQINDAPLVDSYLASLLRKRSSFAEATQKCGL